MPQPRGRLSGDRTSFKLWRTAPWGTQWGQLDDRYRDGRHLAVVVRSPVGRLTDSRPRELAVPAWCTTNFCPPRGIESRCFGGLVLWIGRPPGV